MIILTTSLSTLNVDKGTVVSKIQLAISDCTVIRTTEIKLNNQTEPSIIESYLSTRNTSDELIVLLFDESPNQKVADMLENYSHKEGSGQVFLTNQNDDLIWLNGLFPTVNLTDLDNFVPKVDEEYDYSNPITSLDGSPDYIEYIQKFLTDDKQPHFKKVEASDLDEKDPSKEDDDELKEINNLSEEMM